MEKLLLVILGLVVPEYFSKVKGIMGMLVIIFFFSFSTYWRPFNDNWEDWYVAAVTSFSSCSMFAL
jgi:hypothetical protein